MIIVMRSILLGAVLLGSYIVQHAESYYLPGALPQSFSEGDM